MAVTIRHDTPDTALTGLLLGGLSGGVIALAVVVGVQRLLTYRDAATRRRVVILAGVGLSLLAPATMATAGTLYLFAADDLPQEPLWFTYSFLRTRPPAMLGALLLVASIVLVAATRRRRI